LDWNPRARGREEDQRRPGGGQLWKRHREKEGRVGRWRGWQQTEVAGRASWKPFVPTQETIESDEEGLSSMSEWVRLKT
jgi:hypothetical protein